MTAIVKVIIGLGTVAVGGTGTYLTYDYLNRNGSSHQQAPESQVDRTNDNHADQEQRENSIGKQNEVSQDGQQTEEGASHT